MASSGGFPAADAEKELNPGIDKDFQVDPISSTSRPQRKSRTRKKDAIQSFKTALIVSGIVVAVAGAVFAITKKLREK
ncbi:hypothetical protein DH2020_039789 [Rehmannia glutinosa]|uniref:Transmembrane protein n=1 Tax=Rehmannia glutinosa TaxID=99300 RepID=A0ABR0UVX7_REHGL